MSDLDVYTDEGGALLGFVARVLSARRLVINRGAKHGVEIGDVFRVLSAAEEAITDPETGLVIGTVPYEKLQVRVTEVEEQMSIAETFRKIVSGGNSFENIFGPRREETERIRSPADEMPRGDSTVRIADPVRRDRD